MSNATDNLIEAEEMIRSAFSKTDDQEITLWICRWLFDFNSMEKGFKIKCYSTKIPDICFCIDRGGDCESEKVRTWFFRIRTNQLMFFRQIAPDAPYLKLQSGRGANTNNTYIPSSESKKLDIKIIKKHIFESYDQLLNELKLESNASRTNNALPQNRDQPQYDSNLPSKEMVGSMEHIYDYYENEGFYFSKEILTRYFLSLKTKPFVILTGISGTGKTKIAQIFADYICQDEKTPEERGKRIAFVPVKPDWMDNKGLLGYYNLLDEKYHVTPVLRLLLDAKDHPDKPYFIILDEMNLAKVEQYFSDFLSIMESRNQDKREGEALHLHSVGKVQAQDGKGDVPSSFNIPANVYFTGTVNIDESTYMFSSKVLDRANVIEFNDVNLADYENGGNYSGRFVLKDADVRNKLLPGENEVTFSSKTDYTGALIIVPDVHGYLDKLLSILSQYHLHFGYRVINEIAHFVRNAHELIQNFDIEEVMDIQILQKILPKFHGTQGKLEEPLNKLFDFCYDDTISLDESSLEKAASYDEDASFPRSAQKLARMIRNLNVQGYTSFIE